ncbi:MAG: TIGR00296 family protein [Candidatus Bathyarchaeia archaeon]
MNFTLTDEEGALLVRLARAAITEYLLNKRRLKPPGDVPNKLKTECGVFVTLNKITDEGMELRGCIGYPEAILPLAEATIDSAFNAAFRDPRFHPLTVEELDRILVEVSVLTPLQLIEAKNPKDYPRQVRIGEDGLVVERGGFRGLLLPQVPVEWRWDEEEFLSNCCMKAGLTPDSWLLNGTKVYKFQAIIFMEETPKGAVKRVSLR